jgi:hypothetical protein
VRRGIEILIDGQPVPVWLFENPWQTVADLIGDLATRYPFWDALHVVATCDGRELPESSLLISASRFDPGVIIEFSGVRNYVITDEAGAILALLELLEGHRVERANGLIAAALEKSLAIAIDGGEAPLAQPLHWIAPAGALTVRPALPEFRFVLPSGRVDLRGLNSLRTFDTIREEFRAVPAVRFLTTDGEIDSAARLCDYLGRGPIFACVPYMFRHRGEAHERAFRPDVTLADVAAALTGQDGREFVFSCRDLTFYCQDVTSVLPLSLLNPVVLSRQFPVRFRFEGNRESFEQTFDAGSTIAQLKEFVRTTHPGFEAASAAWRDSDVICAVLSPHEPVLVRSVAADPLLWSFEVESSESANAPALREASTPH